MTKKIKIKYLIVFFLLPLIFSKCQENSDGDFVEPITTYEKIKGVWNLSSLVLKDDYASSLDLETTEVNLTNLFNFNSLQLTLNVDENNQPLDYVVNGDIPKLFPTSGYWKLSSSFPTTNLEPALIHLYSDVQKTNKIGELNLTAIPSGNSNMEIRLVRSSNKIPFATYIFKFFRSN
ncbi:DUF5004 domain-containing protein [Polaribacter sp.]|uniref:DUF5004 domain-containing protein n=1 Tax=Polaribacter sp. TaxID=1920175 RepID=UPI004048134F